MFVTKIYWNCQDNFTLRAMALMEYDIVCLAAKTKIPGLEADDIAQELRLRIYNQLGSFNWRKASIRTWGLKVLKNHLKNLHRDLITTQKRKANINLVSLDNWLEIGKTPVNNLNLLLAIKKLPDLEKSVIYCLFFKNMTLKATAKKIKCTQKKILAIKELAKFKLKLLLM